MASNIAIELARDLIIEAYRKNELSTAVIDQIVDYSKHFAEMIKPLQSADDSSIVSGATDIAIQQLAETNAATNTSTEASKATDNIQPSVPSTTETEDDSRFEKELIEEAIDAKIETEGNLGEINSGYTDVDSYGLTESHREMDITEAMMFFQKLESVMVRKKLFCEQEVTRDQVAAAIGTNRTYLIRSIKIATGKTFYEYINDMRTDYAATLLTSSDEPLDVIGTISGFRSKSTYYRLFSARYGCTPTEYRQRQTKLDV